MKLRAPYVLLAQQLQEAADSMDVSGNDLRKWLEDACCDMAQEGEYCYLMDFIGDGESGDVIYCCNGDTWKAPYEVQNVGGKIRVAIDDENAVDVLPRTVYEEEADEDDHYAAMESAKLYATGGARFVERFISKNERKSAPSASFAGKAKSFPILKAADVMAAVRSIGRAGSDNYDAGTLKRNIIKIAKAKGFTSELPKAWRDGGDDQSTQESAVPSDQSGQLKLLESAPFTADITITEALTPGKKIKLISPGKGSSAYYTREALIKAAEDGIFRAGLPMRIDHPTVEQQKMRPEGSVKDWGAVLADKAIWQESYLSGGKDQGPGLYAPIKTFSDHAQTIDEKGPYAGVSIFASGNAVMENGRPVMREGVPLLKEFTSAEGADMVTRAGAGGLFLSESATIPNPNQEVSMTEAEAKALIEAATAPLRQRALRGDAREEAARLLKDIELPEAAKTRITERAIANVPTTETGDLDTTKLRESIVAESKTEAEYLASVLPAGSRPRGVGVSAPPAPKPEDIAAREAAEKREFEEDVKIYEAQGMSRAAAEFAAKGRAA